MKNKVQIVVQATPLMGWVPRPIKHLVRSDGLPGLIKDITELYASALMALEDERPTSREAVQLAKLEERKARATEREKTQRAKLAERKARTEALEEHREEAHRRRAIREIEAQDAREFRRTESLERREAADERRIEHEEEAEFKRLGKMAMSCKENFEVNFPDMFLRFQYLLAQSKVRLAERVRNQGPVEIINLFPKPVKPLSSPTPTHDGGA